MIVIEGPDNTGKTTLATALALKFNFAVIHSEKPRDILEGRIRLDWMTKNPFQIYDRVSCISEAVYGPVIRDGSIYKEHHWKILDHFLKHKPFIIYCRCSKEKALTFNGREDMMGVQDNAEELYDKYEDVMHKVSVINATNGGYFLNYNYENKGSMDNITQRCRTYLDGLLNHAKTINAIGEI